MQTTYYAAKAIEDHLFDAARRNAPERKSRSLKAKKLENLRVVGAARPVVNPS